MTEDEQRQSIIEHGFLAPCINEDCVQVANARYADWFALVRETNQAGQKLLNSALEGIDGRRTIDAYAIATRLLIRALSNFQGAVLLVERGMPVEAQALLRACYESVLLIGATKDASADVLDHLEAEERSGGIGRLKTLSTLLEAAGQDHAAYLAQVQAAIAVLEATEKRATIGLQGIAAGADVLPVYLNFRQLSSNAAHASLSSMHSQLAIKDGAIVGLSIGPDLDRLPATMALACQAMIMAGIFASPVIEDFDLDPTFVALHGRLVGLSETLQRTEVLALMPMDGGSND